MATRLPTFHAKIHRSETIVKGYEAKVKILLVPKPAFLKQSPEEQREIAEYAKGLKLTSFSVSRDGDVHLLDSYCSQWFTVEIDEGRGAWDYDGGEVSTLKTVYSSRLDHP